jgi:hypothetical protein
MPSVSDYNSNPATVPYENPSISAGSGNTFALKEWKIVPDPNGTLTISSFTFSGFTFSDTSVTIVSTDSSTVYVSASATIGIIGLGGIYGIYVDFSATNSSTGAFNAQVSPGTVLSVPRGSSDLAVPSTVVTSPNFLNLNSSAYQVYSWSPTAGTVYAMWTLIFVQTGASSNNGTFTYQFFQPVSCSYFGWNTLDIKAGGYV